MVLISKFVGIIIIYALYESIELKNGIRKIL